jgi:hypothetical protein
MPVFTSICLLYLPTIAGAEIATIQITAFGAAFTEYLQSVTAAAACFL